MKIAVIGGGIGGLAVAYNLKQIASAQGQAPPEVWVFEADDRLGGNADTATFTFGEGPHKTELRRWADLGVNDFNKASYTEIDKVMRTIGFKEGDGYRPLENTTSYFTGDGSICFTDTGGHWWGTRMDPKLQDSVDDFMQTAGDDLRAGKYKSYTLEEYIETRSPERGWDPRLGPQVVYPRVNGMYFISAELGPRKMPFYSVMHYYAIQEGAGKRDVNRMYFVGGTRSWIDSLAHYMGANLGVQFATGVRAAVASEGDGWKVWDVDKPDHKTHADAVVWAAHANQALRAIKTPPAGVSPVLAKIKYETALSVAHTDSRLLPTNRNAWCTYNILIHEPGAAAMKPYTITYLGNRHQNDPKNPEYNTFGLPEFFVSINPHRPVPKSMVLNDDDGRPAMTYLHHNVFDFDCIEAQHEIEKLQGRDGLYFAGGWTHGSGLHEECWHQGQNVARKILGTDAGAPADADPHDLVHERLIATVDGGSGRG
jgi:predicted NAD/FAD-binding protein